MKAVPQNFQNWRGGSQNRIEQAKTVIVPTVSRATTTTQEPIFVHQPGLSNVLKSEVSKYGKYHPTEVIKVVGVNQEVTQSQPERQIRYTVGFETHDRY